MEIAANGFMGIKRDSLIAHALIACDHLMEEWETVRLKK